MSPHSPVGVSEPLDPPSAQIKALVFILWNDLSISASSSDLVSGIVGGL